MWRRAGGLTLNWKKKHGSSVSVKLMAEKVQRYEGTLDIAIKSIRAAHGTVILDLIPFM